MYLRRHNRAYTWAPRALAVVSFALAMLAAQPLASVAASPNGSTVIVKDATPLPALPGMAAVQPTAARRNRTAVNAGRTTSRFHILATVEILQRLFLSQNTVRPVEHSWTSLPSLEPICLSTLPPASTTRFDAVETPRWLSAERAFAIEHFLLAPPV